MMVLGLGFRVQGLGFRKEEGSVMRMGTLSTFIRSDQIRSGGSCTHRGCRV